MVKHADNWVANTYRINPPKVLAAHRRTDGSLLADQNAKDYVWLTKREVQHLSFIALGWANKQMAAELAISIKTVEKHRQAIMVKLNLHDVAKLTHYALARGLVTNLYAVQPANSGGPA